MRGEVIGLTRATRLWNGLRAAGLVSVGLLACADETDGEAGSEPGSVPGAGASGADDRGSTGGGNGGSGGGPTQAGTGAGPGEDEGDGPDRVQYTPEQANWDTFATKPFEGDANSSHAPDGVGWISPESWEDAAWDGTVYNPSQMTPEAFADAICPSADRVRGIREVFDRHQPFADPTNPTKAEVDAWHRIAINHVRALVGYSEPERQVQPDACMFARALWGDERKFTTRWDDKYPGENGSAYGPCQGSGNAHCGATFIPDVDDQAPYLPEGHPGCRAQQGSEGVFGGPKANIPWSIKWSRGLCNALRAEGFWGGHVGPWFHRERFGLSFWDNDPSANNSHAVLRAKWTGTLMPSLYCNPANPDCDPERTGPGT